MQIAVLQKDTNWWVSDEVIEWPEEPQDCVQIALIDGITFKFNDKVECSLKKKPICEQILPDEN